MADPRTHDAAAGRPGDVPRAGHAERNSPGSSDRTREAVDDVRHSASSLLDEARRDGKQMLDRQKDSAGAQVGAAANALRSAADELRAQDDGRASRFVEFAAERLESFGSMVRNKDIDSLIDDAERLGRRSPAAFFAGSVALGFLLSRFLKSSARRPRGEARNWSSGDRAPTTSEPLHAEGSAWPAGAGEPVAPVAPYPASAADRTDLQTRPATEVTR